MKKQTLAPLVLLGLATASGCASAVSETLTTAFTSAPEWFEARKTEVKGEGYPDFSDVPATPTISDEDGVTEQQVAELFLEAEVLLRDPKALSPMEETRTDPRIWADSVRAELDAGAQRIIDASETENPAATPN